MIWKAGALAFIIVGGLAAVVYMGLIIADLIKDMARRRRFLRRFYR